jgi:hypothetical protein
LKPMGALAGDPASHPVNKPLLVPPASLLTARFKPPRTDRDGLPRDHRYRADRDA